MNYSFQKLEENLKRYWGYDSFRKGQDIAVQSVLDGKDTLVLFPTGGGKSLCYQVPATVFEGITLVISPLVALMQDQVMQLQSKGVSATFINSTISRREVEQRLINARNGMYKLLYCAPERLKTQLFQNELANLKIDLVAVDEAHCISEWGHEFRPAYREIRESLANLPETTRWLALTATATPTVRQDILDSLGFQNPNVVSLGFSRPNLVWWIIKTANTRKRLIGAVSKASKMGDGLMYGGTRKNCESWAEYFTRQGLKTEAYHAGIGAEDRKRIQENWIIGKTPLVVATNAFGMGIDKPNCRYVIHEKIPGSIEAYYQEAGRAGRDGAESFPILFYKPSDYENAKKQLQQSYPTRKQFEAVYQAMCDSFELANGAVMLEAKELDIHNVALRAKESVAVCKSVVRLLNQFGIIAYEDIDKPALSIQFIQSRELVNQFKQASNNPEKAEFVDKLERFLGNDAFYEAVEMEEEVLTAHLKVNRNSLIKALNVLMQNDRLMVYKSLGERSVVKVLEARSSKLPLSKQEVESYRNHLLEKLDYMNRFVNSNSCREVFLKNYFGDTDTTPCGKCDNCTKNKSTGKETEINTEILKKAYQLFKNEPTTDEMLVIAMGVDSATAQRIINILMVDGKIKVSEEDTRYYIAS